MSPSLPGWAHAFLGTSGQPASPFGVSMGLENKGGFKPGVSRSVHLFIAPLLWTAIGSMLMVRGWGWLGSGSGQWLVVVAVSIGTLKSRFILDKTAKHSIQRIVAFEDGTCIGAVYSWKTWLLVALMMAAGITIRKLTEPGLIVGTIYFGIGWALALSSRLGWLAWLKLVQHAS